MQNKLLILFSLIIFMGCDNPKKGTSNVTRMEQVHQPVAKLETIAQVEPFKEFDAFWKYYERHIKLNEDFIGYDPEHKQISKTKFLKILSTGKFQPIEINPIDSIRYQLKRSPQVMDGSISDYMKMFAEEQLVYYRMEGKPVPKFNFQTIKGERYTSENTKGKIVLLKCWFITCAPCVQEMPQLNDLIASYKDRKDIIYLSLAIDDKAPLKSFLQKTRFDYQTVASQGPYMSNKLKVTAYPTHFLINKSGEVVKVTNSADEIKMFLERLLDKQQL
jgi:peroxiredoxin